MVKIHMANVVFLLPVAQALAVLSRGTPIPPLRTAHLSPPKTCSSFIGLRTIPNYSTSLYLLPCQLLPKKNSRSSNRIYSSDENKESETVIQNATNEPSDTNEYETSSAYERHSLGMKSGWTKFKLSLLSPWQSNTEFQSDFSMLGEMDVNSTSDTDDSIAALVIDDALFDELKYNDTITTQVNDMIDGVDGRGSKNSYGMMKMLVRYTAASLWGGLKTFKRILPSTTESSSTITGEIDSIGNIRQENFTQSENDSNCELNAADLQEPGRSQQQHMQNQNAPPIFASFESIDINATTLAKQRRWKRRRRRALVAYQVVKNALFLFIVTFLAGNVSEVEE